MDVVHERGAAVLLRPARSEIDHQAGMRMSPAGRIASPVSGMRAAAAGPVHVIGDGFDIGENVRIEVLSGLAVVVPALHDVPEVRDHAGLDDALAAVIEIDAPRIASTLGENLETMLRRLITPDSGIDLRPVGIGR